MKWKKIKNLKKNKKSRGNSFKREELTFYMKLGIDDP
jgi:hypothetical protein